MKKALIASMVIIFILYGAVVTESFLGVKNAQQSRQIASSIAEQKRTPDLGKLATRLNYGLTGTVMMGSYKNIGLYTDSLAADSGSSETSFVRGIMGTYVIDAKLQVDVYIFPDSTENNGGYVAGTSSQGADVFRYKNSYLMFNYSDVSKASKDELKAIDLFRKNFYKVYIAAYAEAIK